MSKPRAQSAPAFWDCACMHTPSTETALGVTAGEFQLQSIPCSWLPARRRFCREVEELPQALGKVPFSCSVHKLRVGRSLQLHIMVQKYQLTMSKPQQQVGAP